MRRFVIPLKQTLKFQGLFYTSVYVHVTNLFYCSIVCVVVVVIKRRMHDRIVLMSYYLS